MRNTAAVEIIKAGDGRLDLPVISWIVQLKAIAIKRILRESLQSIFLSGFEGDFENFKPIVHLKTKFQISEFLN